MKSPPNGERAPPKLEGDPQNEGKSPPKYKRDPPKMGKKWIRPPPSENGNPKTGNNPPPPKEGNPQPPSSPIAPGDISGCPPPPAGLRHGLHHPEVVGAELGQSLGDAGLLGAGPPAALTLGQLGATGSNWEDLGRDTARGRCLFFPFPGPLCGLPAAAGGPLYGLVPPLGGPQQREGLSGLSLPPRGELLGGVKRPLGGPLYPPPHPPEDLSMVLLPLPGGPL